MATNRISPTPDLPRPTTDRCVVGDTLCHVRVLSVAEWEALPEGSRPTTAEHFPGLGWVVATPGRLGTGSAGDA